MPESESGRSVEMQTREGEILKCAGQDSGGVSMAH